MTNGGGRVDGQSGAAAPTGAMVIGASGQIGGALIRSLKAQGVAARGTCHRHPVDDLMSLDITDRVAVEELLAEHRPEVVYLSAALTAVDYCEGHEEEAWKINVGGADAVAAAAARIDAKVVFFSTEYLFDGVSGPYGEDEPISPLSAYGRSKAEAERAVCALTPDHLIVRTTVVYSWHPGAANFAMQVWDRLSAGQPVRVPNDQVGNPTLASYLADATVRLARSDARGIVNVVGRDRVSRSEFAVRLGRALGFEEGLIEAVPSRELGQAASRPLNAGLRTDRLVALLNMVPMSLDEGIEQFVRAARAGPAAFPPE